METMDNNSLIAEFMGEKKDKISSEWYYFIDNARYVNEKKLMYHSSWDWLMPCIGKISNQCEEPEELDNLKYALLTNNIEEAYKFVIDYLNK